MGKKSNIQIRLKDIAEKAGVSVGTVDRVIHQRGEVSPKTREKVLKILKESRYSPNLMASSLASSRKFKAAVLIPEANETNSFWAEHLRGIYKAGKELAPFGLEIEVYNFSMADTLDFRVKSEELLEANPGSILLAPVFYRESVLFLQKCVKKEIPFLFIDTPINDFEPVSFIGQNSCQSGLVAGKLLSLGNKPLSIYLVFNITKEKDQLYHLTEREKGFRMFFDDSRAENFIYSYDIHDDGIDTISRKIESHLKDDKNILGIFVTGSKVHKVAEALNSLKRNDIRLLGYDLTGDNKFHLRQNTIDFLISQQPEEQGYRGIVSLFNKIAKRVEIQAIQPMPIDIVTRENLEHYKKGYSF